MRSRHGFATVLVAFVAVFAATAARGEDLLVFAAASLTESLKQIGAAYEVESGDHVTFSFAASSILARQIEEGAPADLLFSADAEKVDALASKKRIVEGTRRELLSNRLVVVVAAEEGAEVEKLADLASPKVKTLALAEPGTVPAGIYAKKALEHANLWAGVAPKVVPTENVRAALAAIESGNADAAIVYATDAAISKRIRVAFRIPDADAPRIVYVAAVPVSAKSVAGGRRFLAFLAMPAASSIFESAGFVVLPSPR